MDGPTDADERRRRLRAAIAYGDKSNREIADLLRVSVPAVQRLTGKKGNEVTDPTWDQVWAVARACDLPAEWFSADFTRLGEIVTEGPRYVTPNPSLADVAEQAAQRRDDKPPKPGRTRRAAGGEDADA